MKLFLAIFSMLSLASAQSSADRITGALVDRTLSERVTSLKTDDQIAMYSTLARSKPENQHYQVLLAGAYVQKTRETTDYSYLDRAIAILNNVILNDSANYEAQRLLTETQLERHLFADAAESSLRLIQVSGADPWNWGTLGDAYIEMGDYDKAANAYQKMVSLRPDLASYNRAAHFRFLYGDVDGAVAIMKKAIQSGSPMAENVAWCMVDLGNIYWKSGQTALAKQTFLNALRTFPIDHPAYAGLGKVLAASGDIKGAIENYRRAQEITPLPDYAAALYDLYKQSGDDAQAARQMDLLELIDKVSQATGEKANRNLVFAFADHGVKLDRALELAQGELQFRRDIYSYDALAWALYTNHRYPEAQEAMEKALKLGTPEPQFKQHAQAIAEALKGTAQ
jgi:tetratricopeptide (TPR) repeat protein